MENTSADPEVENKRGCRSLLGGCFKYALIAAVLLFVLALVIPLILRSLGLLRPDVREFYGGAPDLFASQGMEEVFLDLNITGVDVLVIPSLEGAQSAIITMDESKGFGGLAGPGFDLVVDGLLQANRQGGFEIEYFSLVYLDTQGEELFTMATDQQSLDDYSSGRISRSELMGNVGFDVGSFLDALDFSSELTN